MMRNSYKRAFIYITVFLTGAAILIIEILGTRVLAPFYGSTIFVWSSLITVTLGALALGYFAGGWLADAYPSRRRLYGVIFTSGFLVVLMVKVSVPILSFSNSFGFRWGPFVATFIIFSLPLFFFGMVTPFVIRLLTLS